MEAGPFLLKNSGSLRCSYITSRGMQVFVFTFPSQQVGCEEKDVTLPAKEGPSAPGRARSTSEPAELGAGSADSGLLSS